MTDSHGIGIADDADDRLLKDKLGEINSFPAIYLPEMNPVDGKGSERNPVQRTGSASSFLQQVISDRIGKQFKAINRNLSGENVQVQFFKIGTVNAIAHNQDLLLQVLPEHLVAIIIEHGKKGKKTDGKKKEQTNQKVAQPMTFSLYYSLFICGIHFGHANAVLSSKGIYFQGSMEMANFAG